MILAMRDACGMPHKCKKNRTDLINSGYKIHNLLALSDGPTLERGAPFLLSYTRGVSSSEQQSATRSV